MCIDFVFLLINYTGSSQFTFCSSLDTVWKAFSCCKQDYRLAINWEPCRLCAVCAATIALCGAYICFLIQNNLPDRSIIQLYSKSTQSYLCIEESGVVKESVDEKLSKFIKHLICMYTTHQWNIIMLQNLYTQRICYTVTEEWGLYLWMPTRDQDTD